MEKNMDKENINMAPIIFIMEIGRSIKRMGKESTSILKDYIMVNGNKIKRMDKEL